jgi:hypothetical protein
VAIDDGLGIESEVRVIGGGGDTNCRRVNNLGASTLKGRDEVLRSPVAGDSNAKALELVGTEA